MMDTNMTYTLDETDDAKEEDSEEEQANDHNFLNTNY